MDGLLIIILAAAATVALLVYGLSVVFGRNRAILAERLETYTGIEEEAALAAKAEFQGATSLQRLLNTVLGRGYFQRLEDDLARADVPMRPTEYFLLRLVTAGAGAIISLVVVRSTHNQTIEIVRTIALTVLGYFVPAIMIRIHQYRRRNKFISQLADALMLLTNSLRAGYGFLKGLELVAKEMGDPISKELNRMLREINLGATVEQALLNLGRRVKSQDLDIVISAFLIQKDVGGNLTEIMENVAATIRERLRIQGDIRVLTAQGRLSGLVIGLLPTFLFVALMFMTPDYFAPLVGPPLAPLLPGWEVPRGILILIAALLWQIIGAYLIFKVINIRV